MTKEDWETTRCAMVQAGERHLQELEQKIALGATDAVRNAVAVRELLVLTKAATPTPPKPEPLLLEMTPREYFAKYGPPAAGRA